MWGLTIRIRRARSLKLLGWVDCNDAGDALVGFVWCAATCTCNFVLDGSFAGYPRHGKALSLAFHLLLFPSGFFFAQSAAARVHDHADRLTLMRFKKLSL